MFRIANFKLLPRDRNEINRSSTALELMFDLATVVAVSAAAHGLAQDLAAGEVIPGIIRFACSFFMAWLAWANYTWFASGYANQSVAFRRATMVIIFGSLTLAGGVRSGLGDETHWLVLIGFSIMRLGMVGLWLGVANGDRKYRRMALRYAFGIVVMQVYWNTLIITVPPNAPTYYLLFALGVAGELFVPIFAERRTASNWHHGHIIDRHNLFNIIVLGECFAAIALSISMPATVVVWQFWRAALATIIAFSMWGLYFDRNERLRDRELGHVLKWAYSHCVLFASGAATAAGFGVLLATVNRGEDPGIYVNLAVCIPVALYLSALWIVCDRVSTHCSRYPHLLLAAVLILTSGLFLANALELTALVLAITLIANRWYSST